MTEEFPLVSVIIPFFNEEKFLDETIKSVLNQKYEHWELLLVDDGSTNNSTNIAKQYVNRYSDKIRYFDHPGHTNRGSSATRNRGVQNARGQLIAFLDADDIFEPFYLENQVNLFNSVEASMICEATTYWYSWADHPNKDEIIPVGVPQDRLYQPQELNMLLYPLRFGADAPCMCGIVLLKEILIKHGGFDESFTGMYDDQVFLTKMYYHENVYISSNCNNRYRQRAFSLMSTAEKKEDYIIFRTRFLEWFKSYLEVRGATNNQVYKLVKKTLLPYKYPKYYYAFHVLPRKILKKISQSLLKK
ncbi:hypothetical protein BH23BAC3_BH23BAC3_32670 [soil metagenome]